MVEFVLSSPAHTNVDPSPAGLLKTAFLVSNLHEEPAVNVWTGAQEQAGGWPLADSGLRLSSIKTQRNAGFDRPGPNRTRVC